MTIRTYLQRKSELDTLCHTVKFKTPATERMADKVAGRLTGNLARYLALQDKHGVPAAVIMCIHERESGGSFAHNLANGEPLFNRDGTGHITKIVPLNKGPWKTFEESAAWSFKYQGLDKIGLKNWTVSRMAYIIEGYNGYGYDMRGLRSPYLWGGTNYQQPGKFKSDGPEGFDPNYWDTQLGAMAVYAAIVKVHPELAVEEAESTGALLKDAGVVLPIPAPTVEVHPAVEKAGGGALVTGTAVVVAGALHQGIPMWAVAIVVLIAAGALMAVLGRK